MNEYRITFKDSDRRAGVTLLADQISETEFYTAFVAFSLDGLTSTSRRYATDTIFAIDEFPESVA